MSKAKPQSKAAAATPKLPELGDRAWQVEWCISLGEPDEFGEYPPDNWKYKRATFTTKKVADEFARKVYPKDARGVVEVYPVEFVDPYDEGLVSTFRWESCGDSEYYDGPE